MNTSVFNDAILSPGPVLAVFGAAWCAPCRTLKVELAKATKGRRLRTIEIDLDDAQDLALARGVRELPTCILFRAGEEVARRFGGCSAATLGKWLGDSLKAKGKA